MAASNMFLKLDGIDGESMDDQHKDWIEIESWSWSVDNPTSFAVGQGGQATQAHFAPINVTKNVDKASVTLWQNCTTGKHIQGGTISCMKLDGESRIEYLKIQLTDILVSGIQTSGHGTEHSVHENVALQFAKFTELYNLQQNIGSAGGGKQFGWDIQASKATG